MSPSHRDSNETSPLLHDRDARPRSYRSSCSSRTQSPEPADPPVLNKVSRADLMWVLAGLWSAVFLGALDGTIVATLLSPIGSYFNESNRSSYIGTSYLLSVCCFTPLYGRLSDILGRKGAMLLALSFFGSGTLFCGLAPSMDALIAARAIAGMGGGGLSSVAVTDLIPLRQRGLYQGMTNILFGLGAGLGGPLGGWMNDALGWRSAFLLQMPILVFSFVLVALKVSIRLPDEIENQPVRAKLRRIDVLGSFTLVGMVGCLLLGLSLKSTEELPWAHPLIWGLLLASVVFGGAFIWVETCYSPYPVMPMHLVKQRTPFFVSLSNFFGSVAAFSMIYNVPLVRMHLLPHSVRLERTLHRTSVRRLNFAVRSQFRREAYLPDGEVMRRTGKLYSLTLCSCLLTVVAATLVALWNENSATWHLWLDVMPQGFGMASVITTTLIAMIASVSREDIAVATGITYLFRTTGQVIGVSLSGALLQAILTAKLRERIHGPHAVEVRPELSPELRKAAVDSYADALRVVFICQAAINFICFLCCLPIQENPLPGSHEEQEEAWKRRDTNRTEESSETMESP
ncbi:MFS general substrate transporter [Cubamyces menziesii]|nr:MFS general substrate transporter [Cubamyces menziesii]